MRYYVVRVNAVRHTKEYRASRTVSRWTADKSKAYGFASRQVAELLAEREWRLQHPCWINTIKFRIEQAEDRA
ncbi:hypothetical protein [uncultured Neglectibacter sp.]|uniref:hypothetical protein n=1 Tax=uncultured Neglectibacter sp. TaxID=1924108 RepID=UPI0034DFAB4F